MDSRAGALALLRSPLQAVVLAQLALAACDSPPPPHPHPDLIERWQFETEGIRHAVDDFKIRPSAPNRRRMQRAFAEFDAELRLLAQRARTASGDERSELESRIASLRIRRELQRARAIATTAQPVPVRVAERVPRRARAIRVR